MVDNTRLNAGAADGDIIASDDIGGVKYQRNKVMHGADGAANETTVTTPLPVTIGDGTDTLLISAGGAALVDGSATTQPVSHAALTELAAAIDTELQVDIVAMPAVDLGATDNAVLDAIAASVAAIDTDTSTIITAVQLIDNAVYVDDADWTDNTSSHYLVGGVYQSAPHTVTDGDVTPFLTDVNGRVAVAGTVDLGATDNAVLDAIAASVAAIDTDATTIIGHVDGIETVLGTIDADTGSIMTAVQLIDDAIYVDDTATHATGTSKGVLIMGAAVPTDTAVSANDIGAVAMSLNRGLHVDVQVSALPTGAATSAKQDTEIASLATIAGDTTDIEAAVEILDNIVLVDDAAFTPASSSVAVAGFFADEASTDSVDEGDIGAARMTTDRQQRVVLGVAAIGGGATIHKTLDLDESEEEVKATPGTVYGYFFTNLSAGSRFIKFYNDTAANVIVGTTVPVITIPLEPDQALNVAWDFGIPFSAAICIAATTAIADADAGAPGANDVCGFVLFK
jgi:hypothetical protein